MSAVSRLAAEIEAVLFTSARPIPVRELQAAIGAKTAEIAAAVSELVAEYAEAGHGFEVCEVAGGYLLRSRVEFAESIRKLHQKRPTRLSRPALETLAVVAYKQPITRPELEQLRGVDCGAVMKSLLDHRLVKIIGRKDEIGRPLLYGTTKEFLEFFGLRDLGALPTLREFAEINDRAGGEGEGEAGGEEEEKSNHGGTPENNREPCAKHENELHESSWCRGSAAQARSSEEEEIGGQEEGAEAGAEAGAGAEAEAVAEAGAEAGADGIAGASRG